jgi:hypothetical protein
MGNTKIEKLGLQSTFLPTYHKSNRNLSETARKLTAIAGEKISVMAVSRYIDSLEKEEDIRIPKKPDTKRAVRDAWVEEKEIIVGFYQEVIETAMDVLRNAKTDKEKSFAVGTAMQTLSKALDMHGFSKPSVQLNQQFNSTVVIKERGEELRQVLNKYVNGSTELVLKELLDIFSH